MVSLDGGSACKVADVTALPSHIQDGGYALLWQRYDNNKMAAICFLHLQQYSRRLNLFYIYFFHFVFRMLTDILCKIAFSSAMFWSCNDIYNNNNNVY